MSRTEAGGKPAPPTRPSKSTPASRLLPALAALALGSGACAAPAPQLFEGPPAGAGVTAPARAPDPAPPAFLAAGGPLDAASAPAPASAPADRLLPAHRIVTFYGNPRSARMGILGALPPERMLERLHAQAREYALADPATPVLAGLHLVTVVAQKDPGPSGLYRGRMPDALVEEVASWAARDSLLLFLDIQPGRSPVVTEVRAYLEFLKRPRVHLALDPEFAMGPGQVPGREIGSLDAEDVNRVIELLAELVEAHGLPPKVLVVHRFTERMLVGRERIRLDPRVQVVIDMDGFGAPWLKRDSYHAYVARQPVEFAGFKLFYQQDVPLMAAADVLKLRPVPHFIIYQ